MKMPIVRIEHAVPSFEKWKQAFDSDPADRKGSGVRRYQILRLQDDPNLRRVGEHPAQFVARHYLDLEQPLVPLSSVARCARSWLSGVFRPSGGTRRDSHESSLKSHTNLSAIWDRHLAPPCCLDGGDVDLLHRHHRLEGTLCLIATSCERIG